MSAFIAAPLRNLVGKRDADEFQREAKAFAAAIGHTWSIRLFDNTASMPERRLAILQPLRRCRDLDTFTLFCHGWYHGVQAGFRNNNVNELAYELAQVCSKQLRVILYCCSTGADDDGAETDEREPGPGGDGGFADRLRDQLCELGISATVFAHSTPGHTTRNPYVRVFLPSERFGGRWLVEPKSQRWAGWLRALHGGNMRFRFPFMTPEDLEKELEVR